MDGGTFQRVWRGVIKKAIIPKVGNFTQGIGAGKHNFQGGFKGAKVGHYWGDLARETFLDIIGPRFSGIYPR